MSLQSNALNDVRAHSRAVGRTGTRLFRRLGASASPHRPKYLAVFQEFSGRLVHLAIQVKEDMVLSARDRS